ncbi:MAG: hypothetical protein HN341_17985 [Verrucomicrobia bacterium]|jgi:hypothetical protein|nr:hypothetical protein [Verrucomicrobiota bacterium]
MKSVYQCRTGVALLRPWPSGPPLRGRAPQRDAGTLAGPRAEHHETQGATPASAPFGHLASPLLPGSVL